MSTSRIICLLVIIGAAFCSYGQTVVLKPKFGVGVYEMGDMKELLVEMIPDNDIDVKTVANFPMYYNYSLDVLFLNSPTFDLGLKTGFYSTGGRNHYADYSGYYKNEILVNSWNIGFLALKKNNISNKLNWSINLGLGVKFSQITLNEQTEIGSYKNTDGIKCRASGIWIEPDVEIAYSITSYLSVGAFVGYEYNRNGKAIIKGKSANYLQNSKEEPYLVSWTGIRAGLHAEISIGSY